jgi:hypothetical protein
MKRVIRTIMLSIMFLSLAGCSGGCGEEVENHIMFRNESDETVDVSIAYGFNSQSGTQKTYSIIPPHDQTWFNIYSDFVYTASAKPISDWLTTAESKRARLEAELSSAEQYLHIHNEHFLGIGTGNDIDTIKSIKAELEQLTAQIKAYREQVSSFKSCQGVASEGDNKIDGLVVIRNGETAHSIRIACNQ